MATQNQKHTYSSVHEILTQICSLFVKNKVVHQCEVVHEFGEKLLNFGGEYGGVNDSLPSRIYLRVNNRLAISTGSSSESASVYYNTNRYETASVRAVLMVNTEHLTPEERTSANFKLGELLRDNILALQPALEHVELNLNDIEMDSAQILRNELVNYDEYKLIVAPNLVAANFTLKYRLPINVCFSKISLPNCTNCK